MRGRKLVAKVASRRGQAQFPKEDFQIDLETMSCVCPAGQQTQKVVSISSGERYGAPGVPLQAFRFDAAICDACPLRASCVRARLGKGRLVMIQGRIKAPFAGTTCSTPSQGPSSSSTGRGSIGCKCVAGVLCELLRLTRPERQGDTHS